MRRIESYLEEEEISPPITNLDPSRRVRIGFRNATISWTDITPDFEEEYTDETSESQPDSNLLSVPPHTPPTISPSSYEETDTFLLHNLNAHFPNNKFSIICGSTGSGKTLMMLGLLGEAVLLEGESFCPRTAVSDHLELDQTQMTHWTVNNMENWILDHAVAYASQTAWLLNSTIRDNIVFGLPFLKKRYHDTLVACALDKDIAALDSGDLTEVGEKGITLSGGQKARVALARAVYSRAKNVLLDDVLSAVDGKKKKQEREREKGCTIFILTFFFILSAHTARHLYDKCLVGPLMEGRTRILITHHVGLCISGASYLVHLENGRINLCGSPEELEADGSLRMILDEVIESVDEEEKMEETIEEEAENMDPQATVVGSSSELLKRASISAATAEAAAATATATVNKTPKVLMKQESNI